MKKTALLLIVVTALICASVTYAFNQPSQLPLNTRVITSKASWYGPGFHGRKTANGETYNMNGISAAHKTLPFGTWLRVTNLKNNQRLFVRVNDRGPYIDGREIDLSLGAAKSLDMLDQGVAKVKIEIYKPTTSIAQSLNEIYNIPVKNKKKVAVK